MTGYTPQQHQLNNTLTHLGALWRAEQARDPSPWAPYGHPDRREQVRGVWPDLADALDELQAAPSLGDCLDR